MRSIFFWGQSAEFLVWRTTGYDAVKFLDSTQPQSHGFALTGSMRAVQFEYWA